MLAPLITDCFKSEVIEWIAKRFDHRCADQALFGWINETVDDLSSAVDLVNLAIEAVVQGNLAIKINQRDVDIHPVKATDKIGDIGAAINYKAVNPAA